MIFDSYVRLARIALQHDFAKAARCPACMRSELVLGADGRSVECTACHETFTHDRMVRLARGLHCSQCRRISGLWSGGGLVRCFRCHTRWKKDGRPEQVSRGLVRMSFGVPLATLCFPHDHEALTRGLAPFYVPETR